MENFIKYTTRPEDTWPTIATKAYGQPERWPEITAANPHLNLVAVLAEGTVVWVPAIEVPAPIDTAVIGLPPWKR